MHPNRRRYWLPIAAVSQSGDDVGIVMAGRLLMPTHVPAVCILLGRDAAILAGTLDVRAVACVGMNWTDAGEDAGWR